ncbi:cell wall metabolism sensor histidine kinase VicK [Streptococcus mutans]|jgi:two-component system sensor histidine kinase VicK|uniref:histidine kinase n=1 Tax=Streptococcus mutans serotype c (strain ATCC 700610 / UA159) TaxID=210007 RepID=Q8DT64_STRMU|nr:cell wall metabolism sensor histidine kinase VicK [Streptococcus mutans]4I5S_A Chain A, Putative histidine kinase CovS; VicK-like protein [Streptococcus mutans UA159]4I5S_B Chain B, Putative histidine kinase CovS; VicK-like protein [Streptococcus mutans UA159]AAN59167.1 putative histidine kinase CovS; VicK-like protein [Streptococcus mutans UA159]AJD55786.1 histidine kinase CovS [Streptococcus mutans UA159-FR]EMB60704.1 putative histidine kinase CovS [Streptococcus mutans 8ID3]EMC14816.1 p
MTNVFESSPLFLRILLAVLIILLFFYFIFLNYREYKNNNQVKQLNAKVRSLITGHYTDKLKVEDNSDLSELVNNVNDLSEVFRLTHENLAQEKNRLTSILSYMTDGVLATDRSGKITVINDMAQKQLNVTREQALECNILDILDDDSYTYNDLITKTPEIVLTRRDEYDEFITLRIRFALNRRESGFISGLIAVLHDATEQEKEERERRLFVSNVSHELRTPLTSVKSYLEALDDGALTESVAPSFIKVSLDETNRMMRMITDLLSLSRIDNQTSHLDVELTNFTAFMNYILDRFDQIQSQQSTNKVYEIIRDYPDKSVWIEIDTDKMTQVIDNILNNAIKYSPDGGKVTITMQTTDTQLILSISDQGLGIPKKDLPLIFDRFYRVDKARSRAQGGTGLGLAIAKEIVKQHKGFIWANSEEGEGSTFTIVLPYENDNDAIDEWEEDEDES